MHNKALICALLVLINSQNPTNNMNANKQLVNGEKWTLNLTVTVFFFLIYNVTEQLTASKCSFSDYITN